MAFDLGNLVGTVFFYVILIAIGVYCSRYLSKRRDDGATVSWPIGISGAICLLSLLGQCYAPVKSQMSKTNDIEIREVAVGAASDFPSEISDSITTQFNAGVLNGLLNSVRDGGYAVPIENVTASTEVVIVNRRKLFLTKSYIPTLFYAHQYAGISGSKMVMVICTSKISELSSLQGAECERAAEKVFTR